MRCIRCNHLISNRVDRLKAHMQTHSVSLRCNDTESDSDCEIETDEISNAQTASNPIESFALSNPNSSSSSLLTNASSTSLITSFSNESNLPKYSTSSASLSIPNACSSNLLISSESRSLSIRPSDSRSSSLTASFASSISEPSDSLSLSCSSVCSPITNPTASCSSSSNSSESARTVLDSNFLIPRQDSSVLKRKSEVKPVSKTQKVSKQTLLDPICQKTASKEQCDLIIAKFIYGSNLPFSIVEQPTFISLLQTLRPGYKPPSREALSGPLLSAVYEEIKGNVRNTLNGAICALVEDGWSNVKKDPVIATCVQHNGKTYFLRAVETGSAHKDAEFYAQVARDSILAAANDFGARVGSVVTDNAAVMNLARKKTKRNRSNSPGLRV